MKKTKKLTFSRADMRCFRNFIIRSIANHNTFTKSDIRSTRAVLVKLINSELPYSEKIMV